MFRLKVCGIKNCEDAELAIHCGFDAIGLNFVPSSPRCIGLDQGVAIARVIGDRANVVALFANRPADEVGEWVKRLGCSWLQLHGQESAEAYRSFDVCPILRATSWRNGGWIDSDWVQAWSDVAAVGGWLVDAYDPVRLGGTGKTLVWSELPALHRACEPRPWVLAGGLTPENVEQAIRESSAGSVDVASGVEGEVGQKLEEKMRRFVEAAKRAW